MKSTVAFLVGLFSCSLVGAVPPGGWGQPQAQPQQTQGWGQQAAPAPQAQGWGQSAPAPQAQGWGQAAAPLQMPSGWGQQAAPSAGGKGKGKKGVDWEYNFALGYQGDKGKGQGQDGWGKSNMQTSSGDGWGAPAPSTNSGGWSSEPETNIMKPSMSDVFGAITSFPKEMKEMMKESGLWVLALPLLIIIPLFLFAFKAGKFYGGMNEDGWGWDKRSADNSLWASEWETLKGFIADPRVQRAAKGFMNELVAQNIVSSVSQEESKEAHTKRTQKDLTTLTKKTSKPSKKR